MSYDIYYFDFTVTDLSEAACDELMKRIATRVEEGCIISTRIGTKEQCVYSRAIVQNTY